MATGDLYRIEIKPSALAELQRIPEKARGRIARKIDTLAANPRPARCEKLEGETDAYRIRSGDYRILYRIEDRSLVVHVVRIANRKDVYRNLGEI